MPTNQRIQLYSYWDLDTSTSEFSALVHPVQCLGVVDVLIATDVAARGGWKADLEEELLLASLLLVAMPGFLVASCY